jgi:hypothetical protein
MSKMLVIRKNNMEKGIERLFHTQLNNVIGKR